LGYEEVLIVGTDSPTLSGLHLETAFDRLAGQDCVLGPSQDGGIFLLGLKLAKVDRLSVLFQSVSWFSRKVLDQLEQGFDRLHLSFSVLENLKDLDSWSDFLSLRFENAWASLSSALLDQFLAGVLSSFDQVHQALSKFERLLVNSSFLPAPPASFQLS